MSEPVIQITIDGQEIGCPAGSTIYEAAAAAGIHIPTFCHHEKLVPVGACRMCLVEIEGLRGLQTSCSTPVRDGMVVKVHTSPAAVKARKANIEFLLTNHPLDCPVCDKGGECPLQNQALLDGPGESRYSEDKRLKNKRYPLSELIVLDQERCVLCWRCIRYLDEWADDHELDLFGRGAGTRIDTFPGRPLTSKWQGNTIDICPVGALTSRAFRFEARVWELAETPSICTLCAVGCNILMGVKNQKLRRITPRENMDVNDAWICDKGRFGHAYVDHIDRLKTPLIRQDGVLQPANWEEALAIAAEGLGKAVQDHGPQSVAGLGSTHTTNEANYLFQRFMRTVVGTNSVDHLGRGPAGVTPLGSLPDLEHKDVILLLGLDPSTEAPLVELWIKKAVLRHGATVMMAYPRRTELCRYEGPWLGYRPGSEVALMNGLARVLLDIGSEGGSVVRQKPAATRPANVEDFRAWLEPYSPEQVERASGVPAGTLRQAAETLARAQRPAVLYGPDWVQGGAAEAKLSALENLVLLLGGLEAGFVARDNNALGALEMGVLPHLLPGGQVLSDSKVRGRLTSFWGGKLSPVAGLDFEGMVAAGQEDRLKAMWVMGSDPARHSRSANDMLGRIPFLVVQDLFMTETAALADVVFPAASSAETDGSYTNLTGRWQAARAAKRPPAGARSDWWIVVELARRMVSAKQRKAWEVSGPASVLDEISRILGNSLAHYRGLDYAAMGSGGRQRPQPPRAVRRSFLRVDASPLSQDAGYPLGLVTGHLLYDRGVLLRCSEQLQNLLPDAFVMIHPADAENLNLADGDSVLVVSALEELGLILRVSDEVVPGTAFAPLNLSDAPPSMLGLGDGTPVQVRITKE